MLLGFYTVNSIGLPMCFLFFPKLGKWLCVAKPFQELLVAFEQCAPSRVPRDEIEAGAPPIMDLRRSFTWCLVCYLSFWGPFGLSLGQTERDLPTRMSQVPCKLGGWMVKPCDTFHVLSWKVNDAAVFCHFREFFFTLECKAISFGSQVNKDIWVGSSAMRFAKWSGQTVLDEWFGYRFGIQDMTVPNWAPK